MTDARVPAESSRPDESERARFDAAIVRMDSRIRRSVVHRLLPDEPSDAARDLDVQHAMDRRGAVTLTREMRDRRFQVPLMIASETAQVTGSIHARGAANKVLSIDRAAAKRGLVAASSRHFGVAVAYAAKSLGVPATIFGFGDAESAVAATVRRWGARFECAADAEQAADEALALAARDDLTHVTENDPDVMVGNGTFALHVLETVPEVDLLVLSSSTNAVVAALARAARLCKPTIRIVCVALEGIASPGADALGVDSIVGVQPREVEAAQPWILGELAEQADPGEGPPGIAALMSNRIDLRGVAHPCVMFTARGWGPETP